MAEFVIENVLIYEISTMVGQIKKLGQSKDEL